MTVRGGVTEGEVQPIGREIVGSLIFFDCLKWRENLVGSVMFAVRVCIQRTRTPPMSKRMTFGAFGSAIVESASWNGLWRI